MSIDPRSLKAPDPSQWDEYEKPRPMVAAGRVTGRAPDNIIIEADDEGVVKALLNGITIEGAPSGYKDKIFFERVSAKPRTKGRLAGTSRLTDYLLACGMQPVRSDDAEEWVAAINATAGQFFEFFVDWRAYDRETQEVLAETMTDFPEDGNGGHLNYIVNPKTGKRVAAEYRVRYYVRQRGRA